MKTWALVLAVSLALAAGESRAQSPSPAQAFYKDKKIRMPVGSTGASAESNFFPKLLNATLGTKFKTVLGYPDSGAVGIAMERGEIDGYCSFTWAAVKSARPNWIAGKLINVILQLSMNKHP